MYLVITYISQKMLGSLSLLIMLKILKYCSISIQGTKVAQIYDATQFGINAELLCDVLQVGDQVRKVFYSWFVLTHCNDVEYSALCTRSSYLFGCIGLKDKSYCIFNKQYSKKITFVLREKIIKQMKDIPFIDTLDSKYSYGEFFPIELSPFGYNETTANEYMSLSKSEILKNKFNWMNPDSRNYQPTIQAEGINDSLIDTPDSILNEVIQCTNKGSVDYCYTAFKILPNDLTFL